MLQKSIYFKLKNASLREYLLFVLSKSSKKGVYLFDTEHMLFYPFPNPYSISIDEATKKLYNHLDIVYRVAFDRLEIECVDQIIEWDKCLPFSAYVKLDILLGDHVLREHYVLIDPGNQITYTQDYPCGLAQTALSEISRKENLYNVKHVKIYLETPEKYTYKLYDTIQR